MNDAQHCQSDTETIMGLITRRYGARLTPAQLQEVRQGVEGLAQMTAALQHVQLANSDEPFAVFVPYRQEGEARAS
jgi:hypothetical protein